MQTPLSRNSNEIPNIPDDDPLNKDRNDRRVMLRIYSPSILLTDQLFLTANSDWIRISDRFQCAHLKSCMLWYRSFCWHRLIDDCLCQTYGLFTKTQIIQTDYSIWNNSLKSTIEVFIWIELSKREGRAKQFGNQDRRALAWRWECFKSLMGEYWAYRGCFERLNINSQTYV